MPDPIVLAGPGESVVRSTMTLATVGLAPMTYTHAAETLTDVAARGSAGHQTGGGVMVDSLKSLAGTAFRTVDVVDAFRPVIKAEEAVLATYTFLPHARSGISAALTTPFRWQGPTRTTVEMSVPVNDDRPADQALRAAITVHVFGPADVAELDARQMIRTGPKADAHDVEVDDLVQVEFDRPELPWLFTPAGPDAGRLVPWLTLVVARADALVWTGQRGALRTAEIRRDQLQPLGTPGRGRTPR